MTRDEIIKAWFAIDELGGDSVHMELCSYHICITQKKMWRAAIHFGLGYQFVAHEEDVYTAMEKAITQYSDFISKNEKR